MGISSDLRNWRKNRQSRTLTCKPRSGAFQLPRAEYLYPQRSNWAAVYSLLEQVRQTSPPSTARGYPPIALAPAIRYLFNRRHHQLHALRAAGYTPAERVSREYCWPGMARFPSLLETSTERPKLHSCGLPQWCPFCWSREVVRNVYRKLLQTLYPLCSDRCRRDKYALLTVVHTSTFDDGPEALSELYDWLSSQRRWLHDRLKAAGTTWLATVEPKDDGWVTHMRQVLLIKPGFSPKRLTATTGKFSLLRCIEPPLYKKLLPRAVGDVCRYPLSLLTGDPLQVRRLLEARGKRHMMATYGLLRSGRHDRE